MSRRRGGEDPEFGSDSFLDIIANIVGILIILIVIAGVKVARQPAVAAHPESVEIIEPAVTETDVAGMPAPELPESVAHQAGDLLNQSHLTLLRDQYDREQSELQQLQEQADNVEQQTSGLTARSSQLQQESDSIAAAIASIRRDVTVAESTHSTAADDAAQVEALVASLRQQAAAEEGRRQLIVDTTQRVYERQQAANDELEVISLATRELQELLRQRREEQLADVDRMEHRLSPVVRTESDQEIHFRLSSGHISWVPLEPLLERLKRQLSTRGDLIRRFGRYDGVCGPVSGYSMKYSVERHAPSVMDNLNGVTTGYRFSVSRWTVSPTAELRAESVDDALKFGSRFRQVAEAADPDATMTIWLYADDFEHFRRLREFGHGLGLRVAARPLPDDSEITGSPSGSRSSAQ